MLYSSPNFLTEKEKKEISKWIKRYNYDDNYPGWKYIGFSGNPELDQNRFWKLEEIDKDFFDTTLFNKVSKCLLNETGKKNKLVRSYLNGATACQQGLYHKDGGADATALIYCNEKWDDQWGGATVFDHEGVLHTIYPRFGQLVVFSSEIPHFSSCTSRFFDGIRITLAFKIVYI
jgi:hypothetical protein